MSIGSVNGNQPNIQPIQNSNPASETNFMDVLEQKMDEGSEHKISLDNLDPGEAVNFRPMSDGAAFLGGVDTLIV